VRNLVVAGDWACLVRYWIAHRYDVALEAAVNLVSRRAAREGGRWRQLADFLADVRTEPISFERELPRELQDGWPDAEQMTLLLLGLYPRVALCELAAEAPVERQESLLEAGIQAGEQACQLAERLEDGAVWAFFRRMMARGYRELGQLEAARDSFQEALAAYRELARQRPEVYWPDVAMTLTNLGTVQHAVNDLEGARDSYREALAAYRELARQRPEAYRPDLALTLNNLGKVQRDLKDLEGARDSYEEALAAYRELARQRPEVYRPDVAQTLHGLGNVQADLNDLEGARDSLQEALAIRRELARQRPEVYRSNVATTLTNLGNVQADLNDLEGARDSYEEALAAYRELARQRPEVHRPDVATTLNNLGTVQSDLKDLEGARDSYREALAIRRELARQRPQVHRPDVAQTLNNLGLVQADLKDLEGARDSLQEALAGRGIQRLVLVPNRALHVFPLHACTLSDGRYLADACEVVYTPSLSILHRCAGRRRPAPHRLLLAENPTGDLPFTEVEGAALRRLYPEHTRLHRRRLTRDRLLAEADCPVLHYSGHAYFDPNDPLRSALVLEEAHEAQRDRWLSLRDVFTRLHLRHNVLTVLSGCESGMVQPDRVDEYVGLPSGFLYAGATCVLSTLWAVYDLSSALLMQRFHQEWQGGTSIGAALRRAQRWLREIPSGPHLRDAVLPGLLEALEDEDLRQRCRRAADIHAERHPDGPPFASPVHWAPCIATGLAYPAPERS
jgi:CHAT domain-containing protein